MHSSKLNHPQRWRKQLKTAQQSDINKKYFEILNFQQAMDTGKAKVLLHGPPNTPYDGYSFQLEYDGVQIPYKPAKIAFINIPWNPFIHPQTGIVCMDILKDSWSPALIFSTVLVSLTSLLSENKIQQMQSGLNIEAASEMNLKYSLFLQHAKQQAQKRHYKKQIYYNDEQKPPANYPQDKIKQDLNYQKQKDIFLNDQQIKKNYQKKIKEISKE